MEKECYEEEVQPYRKTDGLETDNNNPDLLDISLSIYIIDSTINDIRTDSLLMFSFYCACYLSMYQYYVLILMVGLCPLQNVNIGLH